MLLDELKVPLAVLTLGALLAGCGGGGGSASGPAPLPATGTLPASGTALSRVTLTVPASGATTSAARTPKFIVAQTASLQIFAQAASAAPPTGTPAGAVTANISATAPGCAAATAGITCTISFPAPVGADVFYVKTFDGANATGNSLAYATVNATVTASSTNTIPITLNGTIASLTSSASPANQCPVRGTPATLTGSLGAIDADGNTIVGTYSNPFTITDTSQTGHYTVNTPTIGSSSTAPAIAYDGASAPANNSDVGVFTTGIPGVTTATPLLLVVTPLTTAGSHRLYTLDSGNDMLLETDICGGTSSAVALPAGTGGADMVLNSTRTTAYIVGANNQITIVNLANGSVAQVAMPATYVSNGVAISSDDSTVYVAYSNNTVQRLMTSNDTLLAPWSIGASRIVAWNDGVHPAELFMSAKSANLVRVVDPTAGTVVTTISTGASSAPVGISISPDSTRIAVMDTGTASVSVLDPVAETVTATVAVGNKPGPHSWLQNNTLYVANQQDDTVSVISSANAVLRTLTGFPAGMTALLNSSVTNTFFVAATTATPTVSDTIGQYDRATGTFLRGETLPAGAAPKMLRQSL